MVGTSEEYEDPSTTSPRAVGMDHLTNESPTAKRETNRTWPKKKGFRLSTRFEMSRHEGLQSLSHTRVWDTTIAISYVARMLQAVLKFVDNVSPSQVCFANSKLLYINCDSTTNDAVMQWLFV